MPVFMVERQFAEQLEVDPETAAEINRINDEFGVRWLNSFLSLDKRKTFCLYEADNVDAIRAAAVRAGIPADAIMELSGTLTPDGAFAPLSTAGGPVTG
ncbi:DUF4242 domain-containing protein [Nocardia cyriacigeorgica]|uniref:DUF4242 domain-containing protein n=1 Tax=Nocardia cyriacigeorgica TaxID=135487 RepID=A0A5R8PAT0_9NOCA|nr:DUF4242 domain-containing protein [Nocardia cyriacigeorgica]TLG05306.1 DUF4242 domain-containing protein [Nocardia cyriacigeorgica]